MLLEKYCKSVSKIFLMNVLHVVGYILIILSVIVSSCLPIFATSEVIPISAMPSSWTGTFTSYYGNNFIHWGNLLDEIYDKALETRDFSLLEYKYYYVIPYAPTSNSPYVYANVYLSKIPLASLERFVSYLDGYSGNNTYEEYPYNDNYLLLDGESLFSFQFQLYRLGNQFTLTYDCKSFGYTDRPPSGIGSTPLSELYQILILNQFVWYGNTNTLFSITSHGDSLISSVQPPITTGSICPIFAVRHAGGAQYRFYSGMITNDVESEPLLNDVPDQSHVLYNTLTQYLADYSNVRYMQLGKDSFSWASYYYKFYNPSEQDGTLLNEAIQLIVDSFEDSPTDVQELVRSLITENEDAVETIMEASSPLDRFNNLVVSTSTGAVDIFTRIFNALNSISFIGMILGISFAMIILRAILQRG